MKFSYDLTQAEPIVRDYPMYGTISKGAPVALEGAITTAVNRFALQLANVGVLDNLVGVTAEAVTATTTAASTGVTVYGKVIINPLAVWRCEYSQAAADDTVNTSASATGKVITATFTTDREGDWIYVNDTGSSTGGAGNLFQIGLSTSTTSVTAVTSYDDYLNASNTSDTFIVITNPFSALAAGGSLDLRTDGTQIAGVAAAGTGAIVVLQNYVQSADNPAEVLRVERHSGRVIPKAKFFADIQFTDHLLLGASLSNRVID